MGKVGDKPPVPVTIPQKTVDTKQTVTSTTGNATPVQIADGDLVTTEPVTRGTTQTTEGTLKRSMQGLDDPAPTFPRTGFQSTAAFQAAIRGAKKAAAAADVVTGNPRLQWIDRMFGPIGQRPPSFVPVYGAPFDPGTLPSVGEPIIRPVYGVPFDPSDPILGPIIRPVYGVPFDPIDPLPIPIDPIVTPKYGVPIDPGDPLPVDPIVVMKYGMPLPVINEKGR